MALSSVGNIYLVCVILENFNTCLYGNKVTDLFEANTITVTHYYCPERKNYNKWDTGSHKKEFEEY